MRKSQNKLRALSNSPPGADRVEYRHKSVGPKCFVLVWIFKHFMTQCDVPESRNSSTTILIDKKGTTSDVSNFRPIALMSCIYKLLMNVITNRLVNFSTTNDILSPSQKSARPSERCYEHTYILQSLVADAQRNQKNLAWLGLISAMPLEAFHMMLFRSHLTLLSLILWYD